MTAIADRYRIARREPGVDARVILSPEDKETIRRQRVELGLSQRSLAKMWGVSRRTIQFILDPKKLENNKERRRERGGEAQYYDKDTHAGYMRKHRQHKRQLLDDKVPLEKVK